MILTENSSARASRIWLCRCSVEFPATAAIARTAVNVRAGAGSRLAAVTHSLVLAVIVLAAAPLVGGIPLPALAGVLIATCVQMIEVGSLTAMVRATRSDAVVLVMTFLVTVAVDLITAVAVGSPLQSCWPCARCPGPPNWSRCRWNRLPVIRPRSTPKSMNCLPNTSLPTASTGRCSSPPHTGSCSNSPKSPPFGWSSCGCPGSPRWTSPAPGCSGTRSAGWRSAESSCCCPESGRTTTTSWRHSGIADHLRADHRIFADTPAAIAAPGCWWPTCRTELSGRLVPVARVTNDAWTSSKATLQRRWSVGAPR